MNKTILAGTIGVVLGLVGAMSMPINAQQVSPQPAQTSVTTTSVTTQPAAVAVPAQTVQTTTTTQQANPFTQAQNPAAQPATQFTPEQLAQIQQQQQLQQQQFQQMLAAAQQNQQQQVAPVATTTTVTAATPSAPPSSLPPIPPQASDFELGVQQTLPMTPEEIRRLRRMLDDRQKAAAELPNPPKSVTGSVSVSLDPGSAPAVIRPFYGVSTSLVLLDSTGAPWPVENFTVGNKTLFNVERLDGAVGSSFVITPIQTYGQSNLILKLVGHPTPVVINLVSGQRVHDARVEARVTGRGPNAQVTSVPLIQGVDGRLMSVLDGVPPSGRRLSVSGDRNSQAWMMPNGRLWLRTTMEVVSPAPLSFVSASDGTHVYELAPSAKILTMSNNQFVTLQVDGCLQECNSGQTTEYDW